MMQEIMLVQTMMQVMGDGDVCDTFTLSLCCHSFKKIIFYKFWYPI